MLTVFTPTYNRAHTLRRLYDSLCRQSCREFEWLVVDDGSTDNTKALVEQFIAEQNVPIRYIYKENGGLYTGYNEAYANIDTELCVCIDSDDYMPHNAVELIVEKWRNDGSNAYAGIVGLDFYESTDAPIAGFFPENLKECYFLDLYAKKIHRGDSKYVMRSELMKSVAPQVGYVGEKNFNPVYMFLQVCDEYPLLVLNRNLCYVSTDGDDRMSVRIYRQYADSPQSFAKLRELEMGLKRTNFKNRLRSAVHFVAECMLAGDAGRIFKSSYRAAIALAFLPGCLWYCYIKYKAS